MKVVEVENGQEKIVRRVQDQARRGGVYVWKRDEE